MEHYKNLSLEDIKGEIWKHIQGYEFKYKISNLGRVKSLSKFLNNGNSGGYTKDRILKGSTDGIYRTVELRPVRDIVKHRVNRLVYQAFKGELIKDMVIDHIDHNPLNDNVDNLQQITVRENSSKDKWRYNKSSKYTGVSYVVRSKKWSANININRTLYYLGLFKTEIEAHKAYQAVLKDHSKRYDYRPNK